MNREYLEEKPSYIDDVETIAKHEKELDEDEFKDNSIADKSPHGVYWDSEDVPINGQRLYQLETNGFLKRVYNSSNYTSYALIPEVEEVLSAVSDLKSIYDGDAMVVMHDFPEKGVLEDMDLFSDIVGYSDVKWLMKKALSSDDIVNLLLVGPPGSGKTLFLRAIAEMDGGEFISGSRTTGPGFTDAMFEDRPRFMCLDELDDMDKSEQRTLSDYTEEGLLVETKGNEKRRSMETNTKTFASANKTDKILDQIENRFTDLHFDPYTLPEFVEICKRILPRDYDMDNDSAQKIAEAVWDIDGFANVRKAEDVASLSDGDDPKKVLSVLNNYSSESDQII